jgi:hypothetical protein
VPFLRARVSLSPTTTEIASGEAGGLVGGETGIADAMTHEGLRSVRHPMQQPQIRGGWRLV